VGGVNELIKGKKKCNLERESGRVRAVWSGGERPREGERKDCRMGGKDGYGIDMG
jgi:hypothetical protein